MSTTFNSSNIAQGNEDIQMQQDGFKDRFIEFFQIIFSLDFLPNLISIAIAAIALLISFLDSH